MRISDYLKDIGHHCKGSRALTREQAAGLMGQALDGQCSDLETGAFCTAMHVKGATAQELAGFAQAMSTRMRKLPASRRPVVVLPSHNGARQLPLLTPMLALLLAREGLPVLVHGCAGQDGDVQQVLALLDVVTAPPDSRRIECGHAHFAETGSLLPGLARLLHVSKAVGLHPFGHSLLKLVNPVDGPALIVCSHTHSGCAHVMTDTLHLLKANAMLLHDAGDEKPVADPQRVPRMDVFLNGQIHQVQAAQTGPQLRPPSLPEQIDAASIAAHIRAVLEGRLPIPESLALQVEHLLRACQAMEAGGDASLPAPLAGIGQPPGGRITLVGAGPGDPELLTLRAARAISGASVILTDALVNEGVLQHARPDARILRVGKRGGHPDNTPQDSISQLMLETVRAGEAVVRLKGGDPFIFGRGGEEVQCLRAAGIEPDIIPGITAGLSALGSLGAPLTHREHAAGVIFATGHAQNDGPDIDWARLGHAVHDLRLTLVIYMGVKNAAHIQAGLLTALPVHTPAAIIEHASLPRQRQCITTLAQLNQSLQAQGLGSPAIIVVGDVVKGVRTALQNGSALG